MPTHTQGRHVLDAIKTLRAVYKTPEALTPAQRETLEAFPGFGPVANHLFPNPGDGTYPDATWQSMGQELRTLLSDMAYQAAQRATFSAFYTAPVVCEAMHMALERLGAPTDATVLEPGCGIGAFFRDWHPRWSYLGIEQEPISANIAKVLYPRAHIQVGDFATTRLNTHIQVVLGNVPFANVNYDYAGGTYPLHDFCLLKSLDLLDPGGLMAVITSHYTLDKADRAMREALAVKADFLGAVRLPSGAFRAQGTEVVADILFLRKRLDGQPEAHVDPDWIWTLKTRLLDSGDEDIRLNAYFMNHQEMVLGRLTLNDRLYAGGIAVMPMGDLDTQLVGALMNLPADVYQPPAVIEVETPPAVFPKPPHGLTEGSFYLSDDGRMGQVVDGQGSPVIYMGREVSLRDTLGTRLADLIALRDTVRHTLWLQHQQTPMAYRDQSRADLQLCYQTFVQRWGPINRTVLTVHDGKESRRYPNLTLFGAQDPDGMLVRALEIYDEPTDTAEPSALQLRDVVGICPTPEHVSSAQEALVVSLDRTGGIDRDLMRALYPVHSDDAMLDELGDLVFEEPGTRLWRTAAEYLSGNVRQALHDAIMAADGTDGPRFTRNVAALEAVQPTDILPGDIDVNLGVPWIPVQDVRTFAAEIFRVPERDLGITYVPQDALWLVAGGWYARSSVAAVSEYGTERANGVDLLTDALNLRLPTVMDEIEGPDGRKVKVRNPDATVAARDRQQRLKDAFETWCWSEPARSQRLVWTYNRQHNALAPRHFDGSHLTFPGLDPEMHPRPSQCGAIWRIMTTRRTLLAHKVGTGKSLIMVAAAMKLKQAGLIRRPVFVVPNHLLEQFCRMATSYYPETRWLMADTESFHQDRRRRLTAQMLSDAWDGIIVTHSSFKKIGVGRGFQQEVIASELENYERLIVDAKHADPSSGRLLIKHVQRAKVRLQQRVARLLDAEDKDDGLTFDELGIDYLAYDESTDIKNLETPTKLAGMGSVQSEGSEIAMDMLIKCQWLDRHRDNSRVVFASGTPVSNTLVELYTLTRYLGGDLLEDAGMRHFDAWAATFTRPRERLEIAADGQSLKPRTRLSDFINLPELQQMVQVFTDVNMNALVDEVPPLAGGEVAIVGEPSTASQQAIQEDLVRRYEKIRQGGVDPREDNVLAVMTSGRLAALSASLVSRWSIVLDDETTKIKTAIADTLVTYQATRDTKATQLIFCDLGVHPTAWGYSVYQEIIDGLVTGGIPRNQIAQAGDAKTRAQRYQMFQRMRQGRLAVVISSTQRMGMGTEVQTRLIALRHLDAPWKPSEIEQREGRILRPGNMHPCVSITRYVTKRSFDPFIWQALETKARMIGPILRGESVGRRIEDIDSLELAFAQVKAVASDNPAIMVLAELGIEVARLEILKRQQARDTYLAVREAEQLPRRIAIREQNLANLEADVAMMQSTGPVITIGKRKKPATGDVLTEQLRKRLGALQPLHGSINSTKLGTYRGLDWGLTRAAGKLPEIWLEGKGQVSTSIGQSQLNARDVLTRTEFLAAPMASDVTRIRRELEVMRGQAQDFATSSTQRFPDEDYLKTMSQLQRALETSLSDRADRRPVEEVLDEIREAKRVKALDNRRT